MSEWRSSLDHAGVEFEEELERRGFVHDVPTDGYAGTIRVPIAGGQDADKSFIIIVPLDFPFSPPEVRFRYPPSKPTWHVNTLGVICLYRPGSVSGRPWATVDGLFERVREWHDAKLHGWPKDPGDPDLARFFTPFRTTGDRGITMVSYTDLDALIGRDLTMERGERSRSQWQRLSPAEGLSRQMIRNKDRWAYAADLGELAEPVWDWASIRRRLDDRDVAAIDRRITPIGHRRGILVLRYSRPDENGAPRVAAVALKVDPTGRRDPNLAAIEIGEETDIAMRARAGGDVTMLSKQVVGIVGCGAIGGFVADQLARAGARQFYLVDSDVLRPGNCVRHLADSSHVAKAKVDAVKDIIVHRHAVDSSDVHTHVSALTPDIAFELLDQCDLVIDATADEPAHELLEHLATGGGKTLVAAGLYRGGDVCVVRRRGYGHTNPLPDIEACLKHVRECAAKV